MNLLKPELKKLTEPFTIICIGILVILSTIFLYNTYNDGVTLSALNGSSHHYKGKDFINNNKKYAYQYSGRVVDDEFFREFDMQKAGAISFDEAGNSKEDYPIIISSLMQYYLKFSSTGNVSMYGEISTDTDSMFMGEPPVFQYTDNWKTLQTILPNIQLILSIFAVILSSLVFSKEYASGMVPIIHTAKHGRSTFAAAKIKAFYLFISIVYIIFSAVVITVVGFLWGVENPFADIRVVTNGAYIPMERPISCVALILLQVLNGYLALILISSIGLLVSSLIQSPYISMIITAGIFFFPLLVKVEDIQSEFVQQIFMLTPYHIPKILSSRWSVFDYSAAAMLIVLILTVCTACIAVVLSVRIYSNYKVS